MSQEKNNNEKQKVIDQLKDDPLMPMRHTAEHVLHTAMQELYPSLKKVMGPPIENGFYFDFDLEQSISPEDFEKIETRMQEIIDAKLEVRLHEVTIEQAKEVFKNNPYKLATLQEIETRGENVTLYSLGDGSLENLDFRDLDLCAGPHVQNTGEIKAFKLLSVAGAYYKGDEKNKMLQRIYGTAFDTKEALDNHLQILIQAKENDHRELNKILDIFTVSDLVGKGLVMYTPNGTVIKNELYNHLMDICRKHGAKEVNIPHMAKIDLYEKSGHAEKFKDELFRVISHYDEEFVLKPVNCPHHTQIYASRPRSYRELPLAYVESTQQHRDEKPGSMVGLNRARSFEIDDGHTFCTPQQIKEEAIKIINIMKEFYEVFGMWGQHWVSLSFRDPNQPERYIGNEQDWETAQQMLVEINDELGLNGKIMIGEAALYGPKIDVMLKDSMGSDRQLGTVQIDFAMPQRFGLTYTDKDGSDKTPVMLHRAILGSYHRFIANLMESTKGAFPAWLAPVQAVVIPIGEKHVEYGNKILQQLRDSNIRAEINDKDETMQAKIREAQMKKIPYMLVVGDREVQDGTASVRIRTGDNLGALEISNLVSKIHEVITSKTLEL
jgi:threonyl-tRNA synthetase